MSRTLALLLALLATCLLFYFCIVNHSPDIQADILTRASQAAGADTLTADQITVDGRDVTLTGIVASEEEKSRIGDAVAQTWGVRWVNNKLEVEGALIVEEPAPAPEPTPTPVAAPAPAPAPVLKEENRRCQDELIKVMSENTILFQSGSAAIDSSSADLLAQLARIAKGCPDSRLVIEGHTDSTGSADLNNRLSQQRAEAVKNYLSDKEGIPQAIRAAGMGSTVPVASNDTVAGRQKNRRIEFKVLPLE